MGLVQFASYGGVTVLEIESAKVATAFLFMGNLAGAFMDVIVDAIMVM